MRYILLLNALCIICLGTCLQESENKNALEHVQFEYISRGNWFTYSAELHTSNPAYQLFFDSQTWSRFWHQISSKPVPEIDFSKHLVLFMFQGIKPTGGYGIEMIRIEINDKRTKLNITTEFKKPAPNQAVDLGETNPYAIIKLLLPANVRKTMKESNLAVTFYHQTDSTRSRLEIKKL